MAFDFRSQLRQVREQAVAHHVRRQPRVHAVDADDDDLLAGAA